MVIDLLAATLIAAAPIAQQPIPAEPGAREAAIADAAAVLADGKPWRMVARDGRQATLTLSPDGRGRLAGPVTVSIKWRVERGRFCLHMGFMLGTRCVLLVAIPNGWRGVDAKGGSFALTRP